MRPQRWRQEAGALFGLAWPIVLGNLAHMAIFATDTAFIGHYDADALAAATLAINLYYLVIAVGFGLSMASAPMMANALGRGLHAVRDVRRTVRQAIWGCWAYAALAMAILWNGEVLLLGLDQEPALAAVAGDYLRVIQWTMFPLLGFWVLRFFALTLGRPRAPLVVTLVGVLVNALVNYALVFGHGGLPAMGLMGSGIASILACTAMFGILAAYCTRERRLRRFHVLGRFWRADWPRFVQIWRLGLPIGVTSVMEGILFNGSAFIVGVFGATALAAHAIVMQACGFAFMVSLGLSEAATIRVGLWAGRRDRAGIGTAGAAALAMGMAFASVSALVMALFPRWIVFPFLDMGAPESLEVTEVAASYLVFAALFQIADSVQFVAAGALRGLKDTRRHMVFILTGHMVLAMPIGAFLALVAGLGGVGVWVGFTVGLFCVAILAARRWHERGRLRLVETCWTLTEQTS